MTASPRAAVSHTPVHHIIHRDADGLEWDGIAERVGRHRKWTLYRVSIPAEPMTGFAGRVLPTLASSLAMAREMVRDFYEGCDAARKCSRCGDEIEAGDEIDGCRDPDCPEQQPQ